MRTAVAVTSLLLALSAACNKADSGSGGAPGSAGTSASATASATAAAVASTAKPTATTTAEAPAPSATAAPKAAFVQKGIKPGNVIVGYIQDATDEAQCSAVTDVPAKKDDFTKNADKVAAMVKGKVVSSCPTDNIVGTCSAGFGMLVNYSGPKYTADTAKKDCLKHAGKWIE